MASEESEPLLEVPKESPSPRWTTSLLVVTSIILIKQSVGVAYAFSVWIDPIKSSCPSSFPKWIGILANSLWQLAGMTTSIVAGKYLDKSSAVTKGIVSTIVFAVSLYSLGLSLQYCQLWLFVVGMLLLGASITLQGIVLLHAILRWFPKTKRGLASSFSGIGSGVGGVIWPFISTALLDHIHSACYTFYIMSGIGASVLPVWFVLGLKKDRNSAAALKRPSQRALSISGDHDMRCNHQLSRIELVSLPLFWMAFFVIFASMFSSFLLLSSLQTIYQDVLDIGHTAGSYYLSATMGAFLIGRFAVPNLSDRVGRKTMYLVCLIGQTLLLVAAGVLRYERVEALLTAILIGGNFLFGSQSLYGPFIHDLFKEEDKGTALGICTSAFGLSGIVSPAVMTVLYSQSRKYYIEIACFIGVAFCVVGILLALLTLGRNAKNAKCSSCKLLEQE
ncbi:uncharacterized protein [Oscarella lobularis]|uniref:uncharacterized protein n=1 Tax=Oscarella lobularis TaxID=121494 RepID=UPI0033141A03